MRHSAYSKPRLTQHDLSQTPKAWRLVKRAADLRDDHPALFAAVLALAHYAASLAQGMPLVEGVVSPELAARPPEDPNRIDHGTDILGDRQGRLAGINGTCGRVLGLLGQGLYCKATDAVCECIEGLGLDRPMCCLVVSGS